ncbi:MAG: DMP19 family protein [Bacteroidaceae bacterium]|nr:DMP19 family protein [Bacteroidaceae bacterium]
MEIRIKETDIREAAQKSVEAFVDLFVKRTLEAIGGELTAETMQQLTADQITLLAYETFRREVMEGGFIQLIHNGYGPFIFLNPFAKAMRLWGAREFSKLVYEGRRLYEKYGEQLAQDCTDEEFMALYEQFPDFDELDDTFVDEMEPEVTALVAHYIDDHLGDFAAVQSS